ncbi:MAG: hypothetical protein BMS9Abin36_0948 [Gammaproteobacteria bacterium]|nr:MAG: hypothetical protein BMS9Abin36_0948 [Gammaproteobacteria bacterium]
MHLIFRGLAGLLLLCTWPKVMAAEVLPSSVIVEYSADAAGNSDYLLSMDVALPGAARLLLDSGQIKSDTDSDIKDKNIYGIAISSDPLGVTVVEGGYSYLGKEDEISIETLHLAIEWNMDAWYIRYAPQQRAIRLYTERPLLFRRNYIDVGSSGYTLGLGYRSRGPWSADASYGKHRYNADIERLADEPRFALLFSPTTYDLASGLEASRLTASLSYDQVDASYAVLWLQSTSAVDESVATLYLASWGAPLNDQWYVEIRGGTLSSDIDDTVLGLGAVSVQFLW